MPEAPLSRLCMKIGRFGGDPADKAGELLVFHQALAILAKTRQLRIGEALVDGLVANRMDGDGCPALLRLGHGVMPLDKRFKPTPAQPAGEVFKVWSGHLPRSSLLLRLSLLLFHRIVEAVCPALLHKLLGAHHAQFARAYITADG